MSLLNYILLATMYAEFSIILRRKKKDVDFKSGKDNTDADIQSSHQTYVTKGQQVETIHGDLLLDNIS